MDLLFEIIFEILIEGGEEICANKKISKWIRYPILFVFLAFICIVVFGLIFLGITALKTNLAAGLIFITIGLIMLVSMIIKFRNEYIEKSDKNKGDKT